MERRESAFRKSWLPVAKWAGIGILVTVIGVPVFKAGLSGGNLLLLIIGGALAISGPMMLMILPFMKRGGYGACPVCKASIEALFGDAQDLLCGGCGAYLDVEGDLLVTVAHSRIHETPFFAVPTPWSDIRGVISSTIALSASDYVSDVITDAVMKDKDVRIMEPRWPLGCCVCGAPATRKDQPSFKIRMAGNVRDSQTELVVRDAPYCAQHQEGIDFHNVMFDSQGHDSAFAMRFRSHAFREAFRELNPWRWESMVPLPQAKAPPPQAPKALFEATIII